MAKEKAHLAALSARHAELDREIATEQGRPMPDDSLLKELKLKKLRLKEEMVAVEARI